MSSNESNNENTIEQFEILPNAEITPSTSSDASNRCKCQCLFWLCIACANWWHYRGKNPEIQAQKTKNTVHLPEEETSQIENDNTPTISNFVETKNLEETIVEIKLDEMQIISNFIEIEDLEETIRIGNDNTSPTINNSFVEIEKASTIGYLPVLPKPTRKDFCNFLFDGSVQDLPSLVSYSEESSSFDSSVRDVAVTLSDNFKLRIEDGESSHLNSSTLEDESGSGFHSAPEYESDQIYYMKSTTDL